MNDSLAAVSFRSVNTPRQLSNTSPAPSPRAARSAAYAACVPAKSGRNNPARHLNLERIYKSNNPAVTRFMVRCMMEELANAKPGSVRDALAASDRIALRTAREFPHLLPAHQRALLDEPQAAAV